MAQKIILTILNLVKNDFVVMHLHNRRLFSIALGYKFKKKKNCEDIARTFKHYPPVSQTRLKLVFD